MDAQGPTRAFSRSTESYYTSGTEDTPEGPEGKSTGEDSGPQVDDKQKELPDEIYGRRDYPDPDKVNRSRRREVRRLALRHGRTFRSSDFDSDSKREDRSDLGKY